MEGRDDFYIHVDSISSYDFFPENNITNFRNKLAQPIDLEHGAWVVGLTECSYISPNILIAKGELIATVTCVTSYYVPTVFSDLGENKRYSEDGIISDIYAPYDFKTLESLLRFLQEMIPNTTFDVSVVNDFIEVTRGSEIYKESPYAIEWSKKVKDICGFQEGSNERLIHDRTVKTEMYCVGKNAPELVPMTRDVTRYNVVQTENLGGSFTYPFYTPIGIDTIFNTLVQNGVILSWELENDKIEYIRTAQMIDDYGDIIFNSYMLKILALDTRYSEKHPTNPDITITKTQSPIKKFYVFQGDHMFDIGLNVTANQNLKQLFGGKLQMCENGQEYLVKPVYAPNDFYTHQEVLDFICKVAKCDWTMTMNEVTLLYSSSEYFIPEFKGNTAMYVGFQGGMNIYPKNFVFNKSVKTGQYKIFPNVGNTRLYIYSDIIETQFVGDSYAPLLRVIPMDDNRGKIKVHYFDRPYYIPLRTPKIEMVRMYIRNEMGEAPPFELGSFACTLHFKRRQ